MINTWESDVKFELVITWYLLYWNFLQAFLVINTISTQFMGLPIAVADVPATSKDTALTLAAQKGWLEAAANGTGKMETKGLLLVQYMISNIPTDWNLEWVFGTPILNRNFVHVQILLPYRTSKNLSNLTSTIPTLMHFLRVYADIWRFLAF